MGHLGRGGMGLVLHVRDRAGRDLALKLLTHADPSPRALERFRREGQVTAALRHVGILAVHDTGEVQGWPYITYDLVEGGRTLEDELASPGGRCLRLIQETATAVGHAHSMGVIHRDLKPANVLVDEQGRARVADFGLAQVMGVEKLTLSGALLGTPTSMAPEQITGDRAAFGPPTDVWALGVMLYRALTGEEPFSDESIAGLAAQITSVDPIPPRKRAAVSRELEAVCLKALEKEPLDRYPHGEAFAQDLARALDVHSETAPDALRGRPRRKPLLPALAALGIVGLAGLVALVPRSSDPAVEADPLPQSREERRRAAREARLIERLEEALASPDPAQLEVGLRRFDREELWESEPCLTRLREVQAERAAALLRTIRQAAPDLAAMEADAWPLAALAEALPPGSPAFPGATEVANRAVRVLQQSELLTFNITRLLELLARSGARVTDRRGGEGLIALVTFGLSTTEWRIKREDVASLFLSFARLDVGFHVGYKLDRDNQLPLEFLPAGQELWPRYVRLRMQADRGATVRAELRRLWLDNPEWVQRMGPTHRAELQCLAVSDRDPTEQVDALREALEIDPHCTGAYFQLAQAYRRAERYEEAVQAIHDCYADFVANGYDKEVTLTTQRGELLEARIDICSLAGRRDLALEALQELLATGDRPHPLLLDRHPFLAEHLPD